jgi:hypothetical protein
MSTLTLAMDGNRDLFMNRFSNIETKVDEEAMADYLTQRLSSLVGEFRFNKQRGISYMTTVYTSGKEGIPALRASIIAALSAEATVAGISYLNMAQTDDSLVFELSVATIYGQVYLLRV